MKSTYTMLITNDLALGDSCLLLTLSLEPCNLFLRTSENRHILLY